MTRMQKAKSSTVRTYYFTKKVKCACPGCGIEFVRDEGKKGDDGKLYCSQSHAEIAKNIRGE